MKSLHYGKQTIDESDIAGVVDVLKSDFLSTGPKVAEFERRLADYCGAKYAVAVSSGTAALHLAAVVAGVRQGTQAVTTPMTFLATANSVLYAGGEPVFADIDSRSLNLDPEAVAKVISKKTKAVIPVHFAGLPVDGKAFFRLAKKYGLIVIEDGCHALGAEYKGHKVGSCRYSHMSVFSFHPVKHITTGEGGCITTNSRSYYERLLRLRNHGFGDSPLPRKKQGGWYREMIELGFNYRITDIQCALGITQLAKLESFLRRREAIARAYHEGFSDLEGLVELPDLCYADRRHAWHLYVIRLNQKKPQALRRKLYDNLKKKGIFTQVHYVPLHFNPYYKKRFAKIKMSFPNAEGYYAEALSLPIYPTLGDEEVRYVIENVRRQLGVKKGRAREEKAISSC